ncbi:putative protein YneK [Escherichia coli]
MVTPVSISNYISLPDDFPVRNIAPQVKEVLKDFIDALSTIICDEEWRTSLNINSATKKIFNNLDNLSYIQRTSFRGNDTLYNEKVQFKLTYPARNGRHKENNTAADYLRQFDLLVLNFISRGNFVILPRLWNNSEVHRWFVNKDPNLNTAILDITDSELKEDLLQSLMDSLGSNKHVLPEVCICFLSLLAEQESPHFQDLFLFFANMLLHYHQFMNPNESDLNDVLMPASLSDDKIIKHMARRTLKLFVKNETPPKVTHEDLVKNRPRSPVRPPIPATSKTPDLPERH